MVLLLGRILFQLGKKNEAEGYIGRSIVLFQKTGELEGVVREYLFVAQSHLRNSELDEAEVTFLKGKYAGLSEERMNALVEKLSYIHTGEMVPYYINWYGFYEGHTSFRADPLAIASVFGLKSIEDLEGHFPGRLYDVLTSHFTME